MLDSVIAKAAQWMVRWENIALEPRKAFIQSKRVGKRIKPIEFLLGNYLGAYLAVLSVSLMSFIIAHRDTLTRRLRIDGADVLVAVTILYVPYAIINFVAVVGWAVLSFVIYKMFKSSARFDLHVGSILELTFLEPVSAATITIIVLAWPVNYVWNWPFSIAGVIFLCTQVWHTVAGYYAMSTVHALSTQRRKIAYGLGFLPSFIVVRILSLGIPRLLMVLLVMAGD